MPDAASPTRPGPHRVALLHLGFRPFFLLAGVFAAGSMLAWTWLYHAADAGTTLALPPTLWHAHEMVYGYALAVVAGFLLTAVGNWTGVRTLHGIPLLLLALTWLGARVLALVPHPAALPWMALLDLGFNLALVAAVAHPVVKVRQWRQLGIVALPLLLAVAHALFYAGMLGALTAGPRLGLNLGLYLLVLLILVMARRVVPFFIERGLDAPVQLTTRAWLDAGIVVFMIAFIVVEVFLAQARLAAWVALVLFALQALRLYDWHTPGIWRKPLLWSLYLALAWIAAGFALRAGGVLVPLNPYLALHAFAYGGIGLITLSMMSRVSLGHTGRDMSRPPAILGWLFTAMIAGAAVRVLLPLADPTRYVLWMGLSQGLWILAFALFVATFAPMLTRPRIDGRYG